MALISSHAPLCNTHEEKKYAESLVERGIARDRIRSYGFAFEGKKVLIGS